MAYKETIVLTITYDKSKNKKALPLLHSDYINTLKNQAISAIGNTNKANYYFTVKKVEDY